MPSGKSPKAKKPEKKPGLSPVARARARALRLKAVEAAKAGAPLRRPAAAAEGLGGGRRKKDEYLDPESQRGTLEKGKVIELKADSLLPSDAFVRNDKVEIAVWDGFDIVGEAQLRVVGLAAKGPEGPPIPSSLLGRRRRWPRPPSATSPSMKTSSCTCAQTS